MRCGKHELVTLFPHEDQQALSLLINWFLQLKIRGRLDPAHYDELERVYHDAQEVHSMLETALAREREQLRELLRREVREEVREESKKEGQEEGKREGIQKGEYIGAIRILQRILRRPVSEELTLREQNLDTLQQMLQELETALQDSPIMS